MAYPDTATTTSKLNLRKPGTTNTPNVITDIGDNMDKIDAFASDVATNKADVVYLTSSDSTWNDIWTKISTLRAGYPAPIYVNSNSINAFTGGSRTSGAYTGLITKGSSSSFSLALRSTTATGYTILGTISNASSTSSGDYIETLIPRFKQIILSEGANSLTVANNSRIVVDFITFSDTRMGHIDLYCSGTGVLQYKTELGSNLSVSKSTNTLTITCTSGTSGIYCAIYAGDISLNT